MSDLIKVKVLQKGMAPSGTTETPIRWGNCEFCYGSDVRDYDWLIVYDEIPKGSSGSIVNQVEPLACHPDQTLLVTGEPPSIKIYGSAYTDQFGVIITSHSNSLMKHRDYIQSGGALYWYYRKPLPELRERTEFPKTSDLSTVCSSKQQTHTLHSSRYQLTKYLSEQFPDMAWFGHGVRPMNEKYEAMDDYRYHIAIENYIGPHHWTEKLADCFLAMCLPFYVGDRSVLDYFPEESIIFIPIDDPVKAADIIKKAIDNNEYEKRLPALREARRLVLEKFNFWALTSRAIEERHQAKPTLPGKKIKGRHALRRNPFTAIKSACQSLHYKWFGK